MKKIISFVKSLVTGFTGSLDHDQEGFSQKKILSYCFALMVAFLHFCLWKYQLSIGNFTQLAYVLGADLTFLASLLGINYLHETAIMKNGNGGSSQSDTDATNDNKKLNS